MDYKFFNNDRIINFFATLVFFLVVLTSIFLFLDKESNLKFLHETYKIIIGISTVVLLFFTYKHQQESLDNSKASIQIAQDNQVFLFLSDSIELALNQVISEDGLVNGSSAIYGIINLRNDRKLFKLNKIGLSQLDSILSGVFNMLTWISENDINRKFYFKLYTSRYSTLISSLRGLVPVDYSAEKRIEYLLVYKAIESAFALEFSICADFNFEKPD